MAKPVITYFDIRARAEPIRLILEEVEVEYEERRVRARDWQELNPRTPFGRLPAYREGDLEIWQSHAVFRHLARVHDLYGLRRDTACQVRRSRGSVRRSERLDGARALERALRGTSK
jgi:glutathione S-transferase